MSAIRPEDFMRFFEETCGVRFIDAATGKPELDVIQKEKSSKPKRKSEYDRWLDEQDEAAKIERNMGGI